jgi:hypothetical protein
VPSASVITADSGTITAAAVRGTDSFTSPTMPAGMRLSGLGRRSSTRIAPMLLEMLCALRITSA